MTSSHAISALLAVPLVPVFYHADAGYAADVVRACYAGGLRAFEFTNRGDQALSVFTQLAKLSADECPELVLGIGTIYRAAEAARFIEAGARFVVQPVTTNDVAAACRHANVPWVPGAQTLNEIWRAAELGAPLVKVFPGNVVGPDYIRAVRGPLPTVPLMVTGGVEPTEASLREWFGAGVSVVGIGAQLFKGAASPAALTARIRPLLPLLPKPTGAAGS